MFKVKGFKKGLSIFLALTILILSVSIPTYAAEYTPLEYIVYDENGSVVETGFIPNPHLYYTWSGITLKPNNRAVFMYPGEYGAIYCTEGTTMTISYTLSAIAKHLVGIDGNFTYEEKTFTKKANSFELTAIADGYFAFSLKNLSSDPITIKFFSVDF